MQLQIKHLAPYLPYNLQIIAHGEMQILSQIDVIGKYGVWVHTYSHDIELMSKYPCVAKGRDGIQFGCKIEEVKPLLYPLENLLHDCPEEIRDEFSKMDWVRFKSWIEETSTWLDYLNNVPSLAFIKMVELKYDVFRLIPQGLALDINTVVTK